MKTRYSYNQIRDSWVEEARKHGLSPSASWSDHHVIEIEIRNILNYLENGDRVLDVGCENGFSMIQF